MQKVSYYLIATIVLFSFAFFMNSADYLRKPTNEQNNLALHVKNLDQNILEENWDEAEHNYIQLKKAWDEIVKKIQFSVEKDEINYININIARLNAYIKVEDDDGALAELYELEEHWNNLNR
ncbi:MAG TPA: DUF4363 family protein [Syntrophomonadaceae bacterium]|nr:DUF4363 family protein [Syntrophomonadaceae bacterium]